GRWGPAVVGPNLEAVANPVDWAGRDTSAVEQDDAAKNCSAELRHPAGVILSLSHGWGFPAGATARAANRGLSTQSLTSAESVRRAQENTPNRRRADRDAPNRNRQGCSFLYKLSSFRALPWYTFSSTSSGRSRPRSGAVTG